MEFIGPNDEEKAVLEARKKERINAWKWKLAILPTVVGKRSDGSVVKIWLRFYEKRQDGHRYYQTRYRHYPELRREIPYHYDY